MRGGWTFTQRHRSHIFFIPSSVNGHLFCFHILANVSNAVMSEDVQISFGDTTFNSFDYKHISEIAGSHGNFIFNFFRTAVLFFITATQLYIMHKCCNYSTSLPTLVFCSFDSSYPIECDVMYHGGFNSHFSYISYVEHNRMLCWA